MYKIDLNKFKKVFPNCKEPEVFCNLLDNLLSASGIDTKERVVMFLAQCGHESQGFTRFTEGLNYGAEGLLATFPKYFPDLKTAKAYERQREKIANKVYANRMGNGPESSGDGWKFRGRGIIMATGKETYSKLSEFIGENLIETPDLISTDMNISIKCAIWFWNKNKLNAFADSKDIKSVTKIINGGYNGLEDRTKHYKELMA